MIDARRPRSVGVAAGYPGCQPAPPEGQMCESPQLPYRQPSADLGDLSRWGNLIPGARLIQVGMKVPTFLWSFERTCRALHRHTAHQWFTSPVPLDSLPPNRHSLPFCHHDSPRRTPRSFMATCQPVVSCHGLTCRQHLVGARHVAWLWDPEPAPPAQDRELRCLARSTRWKRSRRMTPKRG